MVLEWWSPNSSFPKEATKLRFYERYGVAEFYSWDQVRRIFAAFVRDEAGLSPVDVSEGWTSPRLGIRFASVEGELRIFGPDGKRFLTHRQLQAARDEAERGRDEAERGRDEALARSAALEARLRSLGIDPATG